MARRRRTHFGTTRTPINTEVVYGSQHVTAIRIFELDMRTLSLRSLNGNGKEEWMPGEVKTSICGHAKGHGALKPEIGCTCGIWSCKSRSDLWRTFPYLPAFTGFKKPLAAKPRETWFPLQPHQQVIYVSAQVQQWGRVIEHEMGYRSEFAKIIPETIAFWPRTNKPVQKKLIKFLRTKYAG